MTCLAGDVTFVDGWSKACRLYTVVQEMVGYHKVEAVLAAVTMAAVHDGKARDGLQWMRAKKSQLSLPLMSPSRTGIDEIGYDVSLCSAVEKKVESLVITEDSMQK